MSNKYSCCKCGHEKYEADEMRAAGGGWSGVFDIETRKYSVITCLNCGFSDLYKKELGALSSTLDFLANA